MFDTADTHPTEPVTAIAAGVESLAAEDQGHWHATTLSDRLIELVAIWERLGAEITRLTGAMEREAGAAPTAHRSRPRGWRIAARSIAAKPTAWSTPPP